MKENTKWSIKIAVYIDGFNMFHHMKKAFGKKYYWLNYKELAKKFCWHNEKIIKVAYFTAYFKRDKNWERKHKNYVQALNCAGVETILGKYQEVNKVFSNRGHNIISFILKPFLKWLPNKIQAKFLPQRIEYKNFEEKRTDVNIAVNILQDGLLDKYDKCFIISGDSDISPAIESVKKLKKNKQFILLLPPWARAHTMSHVCHATIEVTENHLKHSLLPNTIKNIHRPKWWK